MSIPKVCIEAAGSPDDYGLAPNYQRDVRKARARCVILALAEEMPESAVEAAYTVFLEGMRDPHSNPKELVRTAIIAALKDIAGGTP